MYDVSFELYDHLLDLLCYEIGSKGYYSGVIDFSFDGIECSLHLAAVTYHSTDHAAGEKWTYLSDIVPVWWEFHTYNEEGEEVLNNFSFNELRELLKD